MFLPDGNRAQRIDSELRNALTQGLENILFQFHAQQPLSFDVDKCVSVIKSCSTLSPAIYAMFNALVDLIRANRIDDAYRLAGEIGNATAGITDARRVISFNPDDLPGSLYELYRSEIDSDEKLRVVLSGGSRMEIGNGRAKFSQTIEMLEKQYPDLAAELRLFCNQLIIFDDTGSVDMGGESASCFPIWGAVFVNMRRDRHPLYVFEALIHEAGHLLLFALSQQSPVVENDRTERFTSPLRKDPRTMDGIYHAAFVTARMTIGLESLCSRCQSFDLEANYLGQRIALRRRNFADAASVIREHGRLTHLGERIFDEMTHAMEAKSRRTAIAS